MALILETAASIEPLSLADAKTFLKIEHGVEDVLISSMITAARVQLETRLNRAFIRQMWAQYIDIVPYHQTVSLRVNPVSSLQDIAVIDEFGNYNIIDSSLYVFDIKADPAFVKFTRALPNIAAEFSGIRFRFWAGYGPGVNDVPAPIRQAIMQLVAFWYENRGPIAGGEIHHIPADILQMIAPYKKLHF